MFERVTAVCGQFAVSLRMIVEPALNGPKVVCPLPAFPGTDALPATRLVPSLVACSIQLLWPVAAQSKSTFAVSPACAFEKVSVLVVDTGAQTSCGLCEDIEPPVSVAT